MKGRIAGRDGEAPHMAQLPDGITLERNRDMRGKLSSPIYRRVLLLAIAALPVLALIGVFGQRPVTSVAHAQALDVKVTAPTRLRSGLVFQLRVDVTAHRDIRELEAVFDRGWWESMSVNSIVPEPSEESSDDGRVVLDYGQLATGRRLTFWVYFQTNPTNVGEHREDVEIRDGHAPLVHVHRSITIFP